MTNVPQEFKVIQGPGNGCLSALIIAFLFFGIGGPIIFLAEHFGGGLAFFGSFFIVGILINWVTARWLQAQTTVIADDLGLTIEVTRAGLGNPIGSSFFAWDQLEGFQYSKGGRGANSVKLHWTDGSKISLIQEEVYSFYEFLKQTCPDKETHYWFWYSKK